MTYSKSDSTIVITKLLNDISGFHFRIFFAFEQFANRLLTSAGLIDSGNIDSSIFGTSKFFNEGDEKPDTNKKKENIYSNIDDLLNRSLKSEEE